MAPVLGVVNLVGSRLVLRLQVTLIMGRILRLDAAHGPIDLVHFILDRYGAYQFGTQIDTVGGRDSPLGSAQGHAADGDQHTDGGQAKDRLVETI